MEVLQVCDSRQLRLIFVSFIDVSFIRESQNVKIQRCHIMNLEIKIQEDIRVKTKDHYEIVLLREYIIVHSAARPNSIVRKNCAVSALAGA